MGLWIAVSGMDRRSLLSSRSMQQLGVLGWLQGEVHAPTEPYRASYLSLPSTTCTDNTPSGLLLRSGPLAAPYKRSAPHTFSCFSYFPVTSHDTLHFPSSANKPTRQTNTRREKHRASRAPCLGKKPLTQASPPPSLSYAQRAAASTRKSTLLAPTCCDRCCGGQITSSYVSLHSLAATWPRKGCAPSASAKRQLRPRNRPKPRQHSRPAPTQPLFSLPQPQQGPQQHLPPLPRPQSQQHPRPLHPQNPRPHAA